MKDDEPIHTVGPTELFGRVEAALNAYVGSKEALPALYELRARFFKNAVSPGGYSYLSMCKEVFTEEGQLMLLKIRDTAARLLKVSGAVRLGCLVSGCTGDSWLMFACVDRLVELEGLTRVDVGVSIAERVYVQGAKGCT